MKRKTNQRPRKKTYRLPELRPVKKDLAPKTKKAVKNRSAQNEVPSPRLPLHTLSKTATHSSSKELHAKPQTHVIPAYVKKPSLFHRFAFWKKKRTETVNAVAVEHEAAPKEDFKGAAKNNPVKKETVKEAEKKEATPKEASKDARKEVVKDAEKKEIASVANGVEKKEVVLKETVKDAEKREFPKDVQKQEVVLKEVPKGAENIEAARGIEKKETPAQKAAAFDAAQLAAEHASMEKARQILKQRKKEQKKESRRSEHQRRRILGSLIIKAGYRIKPERLHKIVFFITMILIALCSLFTILVASVSSKSAGGLLIFQLGLWTGVFAFVYLFIWMVVYLFLDVRIYQRTKELEEVLPDFLQLASANISAGMPIDRALWFAVRPNFGVLAKEIEEVAKATLAGEELNESLIHFTEKYDSPTLKRSVNILLEGLAAGGEIADLLNKIALNIQETKILRKEMSANVATYAIFITFASIVMAPLLFALATELLSIIVRITSTLDLSSSTGSFFTLNMKTSPKMVSDFKWFSILMLSISAIMSASIVSVIRKGRVKDGLRNLPIFIAVSLILYLLGVSVLHALLSSVI